MMIFLLLLICFSHTLAEDCTDGEVVVKREVKVIQSTDTVGNMNQFVMPESGFMGIQFDVQGTDGSQQKVGFPDQEKCFFHNNKWLQISTYAIMKNNNTILRLGFETPTCLRECIINSPPQSLKSFSVMANGPSKWITKTPPSQCNTTYTKYQKSITPSICMEPSTPHEGPSSLLWLLIIPMCIIVGLGLFVWKRAN